MENLENQKQPHGSSCSSSSSSYKHKRGMRTIDSFFTKRPKTTPTGATGNNETEILVPEAELVSAEAQSVLLPRLPVPLETEIMPNENKNKQDSQFSSDIGHYVGKSTIDDLTKANLLEHPWIPPKDPYSFVNKRGKQTKKYAQRSHFQKFHWLVLSHKDQGLYCKFCVLFGKSSQRNSHSLGRLVTTPLKAFDDLLGEKGALGTHDKNQYHKRAVELGKNFLKTFHTPTLEVSNLVSKHRQVLVEENRQRLRPIVSTIILCGRQNFALRGHRDFGSLNEHKIEETNCDSQKTEENQSVVFENDGNFRALLRFRIESGDKLLENHIASTKSNATYISKNTQNELINACKGEIQQILLNRVKEAQLFSVIFDETTDLSHTSQLSLCLRYLFKGTIREDFVTFCNAYASIRNEDTNGEERRLTGKAIAHIVADLLSKFNIDPKYCVGVGVDSCSTMASDVKGAAAILKETAIYAERCPCSNHVLNNSLARSSSVTACMNATATMKKVIAFSNASAKRHAIFKAALKGSLQGLCETRWVERHDGYLQFQGNSLVEVCNALDEISQWKDSSTSSEANCLYQALRSSDFLVASVCLYDVLGTTVSLSKFLQYPKIEMTKATGYIQDTLTVLENKRSNATSYFNQLFLETEDLASKLDTEIKMPRTASRQTQRANVPAKTPEEYVRKVVYIPLLDNIITDLKNRLSSNVMKLFNLNVFLPRASHTESDILTVREVAENYSGLLKASVSSVVSEYELWTAKWKRTDKVPECLLDVIEECDKDMYPSINCLLRLLATLPVSAASSERSFSSLRRVKNWLRASMTEDRLVGLALLNIHKDIEINVENIITRFAKSAKRRLEFVL